MSAVWRGVINYTSIPTHVVRVVFSRDAGLRVARGSDRQFKTKQIHFRVKVCLFDLQTCSLIVDSL